MLENLLIGIPGQDGRIDRAGGLARLAEIGRQHGLTLDPDLPVSALSVGEQQRLEIVKALFRGAKLLILDEPTAVLAPTEVDGLFSALRSMAAHGLGIIFISHKLNEVRALTHRCVVLRHGRVAGLVDDPAGTTSAEMARLMCGHEIVAPARGPSTPGRRGADPRRHLHLASFGHGAARSVARASAQARSSASPVSPAMASAHWRK